MRVVCALAALAGWSCSWLGGLTGWLDRRTRLAGLAFRLRLRAGRVRGVGGFAGWAASRGGRFRGVGGFAGWAGSWVGWLGGGFACVLGVWFLRRWVGFGGWELVVGLAGGRGKV
ncbi:hypothetical protein GCM10023088_81780 [Actinomadura verrucosospora]